MDEDPEAINFPRVRQLIRAGTGSKPCQLVMEPTPLAATKFSATKPGPQPSLTFYFGDRVSLSFQDDLELVPVAQGDLELMISLL